MAVRLPAQLDKERLSREPRSRAQLMCANEPTFDLERLAVRLNGHLMLNGPHISTRTVTPSCQAKVEIPVVLHAGTL